MLFEGRIWINVFFVGSDPGCFLTTESGPDLGFFVRGKDPETVFFLKVESGSGSTPPGFAALHKNLYDCDKYRG